MVEKRLQALERLETGNTLVLQNDCQLDDKLLEPLVIKLPELIFCFEYLKPYLPTERLNLLVCQSYLILVGQLNQFG